MKDTPLHHSQYAENIQLQHIVKKSTQLLTDSELEKTVEQLLDVLKPHINRFSPTSHLRYDEKRQLLHGVLNTLGPNELGSTEMKLLDQLLQTELANKELTSTEELNQLNHALVGKSKVVVWQGDITTLKVDAIVNAANNQMLGCFQPLHACIDNAIHSSAGVQLRDDCNTIMEMQGFAEPTGTAKITRAYNLPSKYVLHTVGPIVQGQVTDHHKQALSNAYISCLNICKEIDSIKSIAFCGISTGVFGYPVEQAAVVALQTVKQWLIENPHQLETVVFNVFGDKDKMIYESLI